MPGILHRQKSDLKATSLIFQRKKLENEYRDIRYSGRRRAVRFSVFYVFYILVLAIRETINMADHDNFHERWSQYLYLAISLLAFLVVFGFYMKKARKYKYTQHKLDLIILFFSIVIIVFYYALAEHSDHSDEGDPFWVGYNHQALILVTFFLLKTWTYKILLIIFSAVFAFIYHHSKTSKIYIIEVIYFLLVISWFVYMNEKYEQSDLKESYRTSQYSKNWGNLIYNLPEGVLMVNKEYQIVYRNPAFSALIGSSHKSSSTDSQDIWTHLRGVTDLRLRESIQRSKQNKNDTALYKFKSSVAPMRAPSDYQEDDHVKVTFCSLLICY